MRAPRAGRRFCAASSPLRLARIDARRRELLEEIYSDWGRGDFSRADVFWDDAEFVFSDEFPDPGTWRGLGGLAAAMRQWLAPWEGFTVAAEEFVGDGDVLVALVLLRARARASGAVMERRAANVHVFRGDRMSRIEIYPTREAALRAAGLAADNA